MNIDTNGTLPLVYARRRPEHGTHALADVFNTGVVLTTASALLALLSLIFLFTHFLSASVSHARSGLRLQALLVAFCTLWIFATLIAFDVIARTRQAKVSASLGGVALPASIIQQQQQQLGVSTVYWDAHYRELPSRWWYLLC